MTCIINEVDNFSVRDKGNNKSIPGRCIFQKTIHSRIYEMFCKQTEFYKATRA